MDEPETAIIATSHIAGTMNYPSTTQALFALIVMIIVLLFILVYCCWGTFTCTRQRPEDASVPATEDRAGSNGPHGVRHILRGSHTVIVPINNMIYVGDPETNQIYQIPLDRDKPPAYTEVYRTGPPPPYRPDITTSDSELSSSATTQRELSDNTTALPESPPTYDESLSAAPQEFGAVQSSSAVSDPLPQQQQDGSAAPATGTTTAPAVTDSPLPPPSEPSQEVQESPPLRPGVVLTVNTLPQVLEQNLVSSQPTEERSSATHAMLHHTQDGKEHQ